VYFSNTRTCLDISVFTYFIGSSVVRSIVFVMCAINDYKAFYFNICYFSFFFGVGSH
jgi:hypothetical protein